jgi:hypothetical protein
MKKTLITFALILIYITALAQKDTGNYRPKFSITLGSGYIFQYYNKISQPSTTGSQLRLDKYSNSLPIAYRLQLNYYTNENTEIRILVSPFSQRGAFTPNDEIKAETEEFNANEEINTYFAFNSVRVGFAKKISEGTFNHFKIGGTLVARKWEVGLNNSTKKTYNSNILALPLLYVGYEKNILPKVNLTADLDILGFPFAYVLEGGWALNYNLQKHISVGLQYRILSGAYISSEINNKLTAQNIGLALTAKF